MTWFGCASKNYAALVIVCLTNLVGQHRTVLLLDWHNEGDCWSPSVLCFLCSSEWLQSAKKGLDCQIQIQERKEIKSNNWALIAALFGHIMLSRPTVFARGCSTNIAVRGMLRTLSLIHGEKLLGPFSQHARDWQVSACNQSFITFIKSHGCKEILISLLHAKKMDDAVWLYVFNIGFPASPFRSKYK